MDVQSASYNAYGLIVAVIDGEEVTMTNDADSPAREAIAAWEQAGNEIEAAPPTPVVERAYSFLEFLDLFTGPEQLALMQATMADPAVALWHTKAVGAQEILLSDPRTIAGVNSMVTAGLLEQARAEAILQGQPL